MPELASSPRPRTHADLMMGAPQAAKSVRILRVIAVSTVLLLLFVIIPALCGMDSIPSYLLNRFGRYLAIAIVALGIDLIWGYSGVLSLCQAFFFCIGGYAMGMYLACPNGGGDVRPEYHNIPQFLYFANPDSSVLPAFWRPFNLPHPWAELMTIATIIGVPALIAGVLGYMLFRSRVRGVYFSIVTQAIAWGTYLLVSRNEMLLGGSNGLTNFYKPFNQEKSWIIGLYMITLIVLGLSYLLCLFITRSRSGRVLVAVRDKETRLYFAGYRPYGYKLFGFVVAAVLAAIGGMLYAPQTGIINPKNMEVSTSIDLVICVAVGGRGRLWGAVIGALFVNFMLSAMTSDIPKIWPFVDGGIFLAVVLLIPDGFVGMWDELERRITERTGWVSILSLTAILLSVAVFTLTEAVGWVPDAMRKPAFTFDAVGAVPWRYLLLILVIVGAAICQKLFVRRHVVPNPQEADLVVATGTI